MSKLLALTLSSILLVFSLAGCSSQSGKNETSSTQSSLSAGSQTETSSVSVSSVASASSQDESKMNDNIFYIKANGTTFTVAFSDNSSAKALKELLSKGDVSIAMHDYGDFEKVGLLGTTLPRNDTQITTEPGDVILYQGNQITVYYGENSWNFTRLGKIDNATKEKLLSTFGDGNVTVTLSLNN